MGHQRKETTPVNMVRSLEGAAFLVIVTLISNRNVLKCQQHAETEYYVLRLGSTPYTADSRGPRYRSFDTEKAIDEGFPSLKYGRSLSPYYCHH
jgi:hypothetical protein